jgi:transposase
MASVHGERLDHWGLMAAVIKDLGLIDLSDARLVPEAQEESRPGEAVAGMLLNGVGFSNRPVSLTPQFFANQPLDLLWREGVRAEMCNRLKLGRTLTAVHAYGCDLWWSALARAVCVQASIDLRFNHLDTTSCSLTGDDVPETDEHAMTITHGSSKDHRPDVQQAVLELIVAQDGGGPCVSKRWDGHAFRDADVPGARRSPERDLAALAHASVSGGRRHTGPCGQCRQPQPARLYHAHSQHAHARLTGDHPSAHVGQVAVAR